MRYKNEIEKLINNWSDKSDILNTLCVDFL